MVILENADLLIIATVTEFEALFNFSVLREIAWAR